MNYDKQTNQPNTDSSDLDILVRNGSRFAVFFDSAFAGVCICDLEGVVTDANPEFLKMFGVDLEEIGRGVLNLTDLTSPGCDASELLAQVKSVRSHGPVVIQCSRRDGNHLPVWLHACLLDENPACILVSATDLTEYHRLDRAFDFLNRTSKVLGDTVDLERTLANLGNLLVPELADWCVIYLVEDGQPKPVIIAHHDPSKARWAHEVQARYPLNMEDETGIARVLRTGEPNLVSTITPEMLERSAIDEEHRKVLERVKIRSTMLLPMIARDQVQGCIALVSEQPGRYQAQDLLFGMEIAHRAAMAVDHARLFRSIEGEVKQRTQELQAVNKELESFAYSVSHDLRAPLRSIMSSSMILLEDYEDRLDEEGKAELKRAAAAAKRMSRLIDDLLQYSRLGRREMTIEKVDLSALARSIGNELSMPDEVLDVESGIVVQGDQDLLRVMLTNLIENAWKFSREKPNPKIEVKRAPEGENAFQVSDNGVGFDPAFADKLFVPFERLHSPNDYPGTGIGLANVKRIVSRHGGEVWATGEVGTGATIGFTLHSQVRG